MEKELDTKLTEAKKKEELPISFLTAFISKGWDEVGILKEEITAIKRDFSGTAKVANLIQDLVDAYLICIGQLELHLHNNDYIEYPEAEDANKLVESFLDTDVEIEEPVLGKVNIPDLSVKEVEDQEEVSGDFADKMNFLAKDEQEAIDGYDKVIDTLGDGASDFVKDQLEKIKTEEEAHKDYLEKVQEDPTIEYTEPLDTEETGEDMPEVIEIKKVSVEPFEYFCDFPELSIEDLRDEEE